MSKTHKHQLKYDVYNNNLDSVLTSDWVKVPGQAGKRGKYYRSWSNRKCRRKARALIQQQEYDKAIVLKPENVDWKIW